MKHFTLNISLTLSSWMVCNLEHRYWCFRETSCLHLQGRSLITHETKFKIIGTPQLIQFQLMQFQSYVQKSQNNNIFWDVSQIFPYGNEGIIRRKRHKNANAQWHRWWVIMLQPIRFQCAEDCISTGFPAQLSIRTYLLTYSMEQSPSWEANWFCS